MFEIDTWLNVSVQDESKTWNRSVITNQIQCQNWNPSIFVCTSGNEIESSQNWWQWSILINVNLLPNDTELNNYRALYNTIGRQQWATPIPQTIRLIYITMNEIYKQTINTKIQAAHDFWQSLVECDGVEVFLHQTLP